MRVQRDVERALGVAPVFYEDDFHMERGYDAAGYGKFKGSSWGMKKKPARGRSYWRVSLPCVNQ